MKIIITDAYARGTYLAQLLSRNNEDITIIDRDTEGLAERNSPKLRACFQTLPNGCAL